jgi:hypothetical protein
MHGFGKLFWCLLVFSNSCFVRSESHSHQPSDGWCSVPSHRVGQCCFRPPFRVVRSPWDGPSDAVLTTRVPDGSNPLWKNLLLLGQAYPMSESSQWLCVFLRWSCYVRRWWDRFQYSSTCCQVRVGTCGHVLSCQALNVIASRGSGSGDAYPVLKAPGRGCREPGYILSCGMRRTRLTGGKILSAHGFLDKGNCWYGLLPGLVCFRLMVPPL